MTDYLNAAYISARRAERSDAENYAADGALCDELTGFNPEACAGVYNGESELSWVVPVTADTRGSDIAALMVLAVKYHQESILFVDRGRATLWFTSGRNTRSIGQARIVDRRPQGDYTALVGGKYLCIE